MRENPASKNTVLFLSPANKTIAIYTVETIHKRVFYKKKRHTEVKVGSKRIKKNHFEIRKKA